MKCTNVGYEILNSADWHLGKKQVYFILLPEQTELMSEICKIADDPNVDLIILISDLLDIFNPSLKLVGLCKTTSKDYLETDSDL